MMSKNWTRLDTLHSGSAGKSISSLKCPRTGHMPKCSQAQGCTVSLQPLETKALISTVKQGSRIARRYYWEIQKYRLQVVWNQALENVWLWLSQSDQDKDPLYRGKARTGKTSMIWSWRVDVWCQTAANTALNFQPSLSPCFWSPPS